MFSEICNRLPKRNDQNSKYAVSKENNFFNEKENSDRNFTVKNVTAKQTNLNTHNTLRSLSNNSIKEQPQTRNQKPSHVPPLDYKSLNILSYFPLFFIYIAKEFIKKELVSLKELMIELKQKMDTHTHDEYGFFF